MMCEDSGFGSNWWARFGLIQAIPSYTAGAVLQLRGRALRKKIKRHWIVPGLIRFNGLAISIQISRRAIGEIFGAQTYIAYRGNASCSSERPEDQGLRTLPRGRVERAIASLTLTIRAGDQNHATDFSHQLREQQEAMLLMKAGAWVRNGLGIGS